MCCRRRKSLDPLKGFATKGGLGCHDFMKVCVGRVQVGHGQGQGESLQVL